MAFSHSLVARLPCQWHYTAGTAVHHSRPQIICKSTASYDTGRSLSSICHPSLFNNRQSCFTHGHPLSQSLTQIPANSTAAAVMSQTFSSTIQPVAFVTFITISLYFFLPITAIVRPLTYSALSSNSTLSIVPSTYKSLASYPIYSPLPSFSSTLKFHSTAQLHPQSAKHSRLKAERRSDDTMGVAQYRCRTYIEKVCL